MNLLSLRDLALRNNQLRSIPTSLKKIDTLEAVDVRDNEILIMPNLGDNIQVHQQASNVWLRLLGFVVDAFALLKVLYC